MEFRSEGHLLAEAVDKWYKDQFLDRLLAQKAEDDHPAGANSPWRNRLFSILAAFSISTGPILPSLNHIDIKFLTPPNNNCHSATYSGEIICPNTTASFRQIAELLPIPSRLSHLSP